MSNSSEQTLGENSDQNPSNNTNHPNDQSQEWETMARAWVTAFPEAKAVNANQVEAWIDSNYGSLPVDLQSMPRSDLINRLLSIQHYMRPQAPPQPSSHNQISNPAELIPTRFQRTDQWKPVYTWLESLDRDEVVKSKEIAEWLDSNAEFKEQLCSRHSRYHLMHYIKKCHFKILKRRGKQGLLQPVRETALEVYRDKEETHRKKSVTFSGTPFNNIPYGSDLYYAKRSEALRKFEILVEFEKMISPIFSSPQAVNK